MSNEEKSRENYNTWFIVRTVVVLACKFSSVRWIAVHICSLVGTHRGLADNSSCLSLTFDFYFPLGFKFPPLSESDAMFSADAVSESDAMLSVHVIRMVRVELHNLYNWKSREVV